MKHIFILLLLVAFCIPASAQSVPDFLTNKSNFCITTSSYQGNWSLIGPKSFTTVTNEPYVAGQITQYMGRIEEVWVDPSDEDHILAASNSGGLFEWTSSSSEWVPKTNQLPGIGVNAIAVYQGSSSNIIALGTQTNNMGKLPWTHYGWGIIYSIDNGNTWLLDPDFYLANFVAWNPPPVVYALKFIPGSDGLIAVTKNKVWKKATFGGSWSNISPSVSSTFEFKDMETKVTSGGSTIIWLTGNDPALPGAPWKLFYSVNGIWSDITITLPTTNPPNWINVSLPSANDAYVYFFQQSPTDGYIFHYALGGSTYAYSGSTNPGRKGTEFEVSPADHNVMYSAGHSCSGCSGDAWKSINGGTSFSEIYSIGGTGYGRHVDPRSLLIYSSTTTHTNEIGDNDKLFIGNDGGVSKTINPSTASGITQWANLNQTGLAVTQFWGFSGVEEQPKLLFGGTQDNHTFRIENTNISFVHSDGDGYETESYKNTSGDVLIFYQKGGGTGPSNAYRKTDGISNSTIVEPSGVTVNRELSQPLYKYGNTQSEKFLLGANDLFISTDDGNPSNYVPQGLNAAFPFNGGENAVTAIDVSATNSNRIYAAFNGVGSWTDNNVYPPVTHTYYPIQLYFNDPSNGWVNRTPGYPSSNPNDYPTNSNPITGIAMDPDDYNKVWITLDGWSYDALGDLSQYKSGSIYYSDNAGSVWHPVSTTGLPNFPILNIVFQRSSGGIVYIGTLAGIYRWVQSGANAWDGSWECFSNNLPAAVISDLEINYCAGRLRAATWGRGVWETNLYPQTLLTPETITTQTWNTSQKRLRSIVIPTGNTLTISGSTTVINMCANTYIKVMPGAKLVIDGATISNSCGYMWSGIQVVGDPTKTQTAANQGVLEMKNGAKIENAYVAVMADEAVYTAPDYAFPNGSTSFGGGIIKLDGSTITQCRNGVGFAPYPASGLAQPNKSYIRLCTLSCTGLLNTANPNYTNEFISLNAVRGVQIQGNTFNGFVGAPLTQRGIAISSWNSGYLVNIYCAPNQIPPCNTFTQNSFNDLYRGVYALVSNPSQLLGVLTIDQNIFTGCSRNIYLSGYNTSPEVTRNEINLTLSTSDTTYAIYASACDGYSIEENDINGQSQTLSYGILINNSGPYDNVVYKNYLSSLRYGCISKNQNANEYTDIPNLGLQFRCNEFDDVRFNIAVFTCTSCTGYDETIRKNQGICDATVTGPAGNTFSNIPGGGYSLWKQANPKIYYHHHSNSPYAPPTGTWLRFIPDDCLIDGDENSCASNFFGEFFASSSSNMMNSISSEMASADSLMNKIDGGSTQQLLDLASDAVVSSASATESLLAASPYLSDTVLLATIKRIPSLTDAELEQLMKANAPVSENVYEVLSVTKSAVANDADLLQVQIDGFSSMQKLANEISNAHFNQSIGIHKLVRYFLSNEKADSALQYLLSIGANYRALPLALAFSDFKTSQQIIDEMSVASESENNLRDYYQLLLDQQQSGKSLYELDESQIEQVRKWANETSEAGYYALNMLSLHKGEMYYEDFPVIEESVDQDEKIAQQSTDKLTSSSVSLRVIPNPAADKVTLSVINYAGDTEFTIEVFDFTGNLKFATYLQSGTAKDVDISELSPGVYMFRAVAKSGSSASQKVMVVRE